MMDVKTAILQGKPLERDVYTGPAEEAKTASLWKLKKCVYGLNEASKYWYNQLIDELHPNMMKICFIGDNKENVRKFLSFINKI